MNNFNVKQKLCTLRSMRYALTQAISGSVKYGMIWRSPKKNRLKLQEVERKIQAYELTLVENILTTKI